MRLLGERERREPQRARAASRRRRRASAAAGLRAGARRTRRDAGRPPRRGRSAGRRGGLPPRPPPRAVPAPARRTGPNEREDLDREAAGGRTDHDPGLAQSTGLYDSALREPERRIEWPRRRKRRRRGGQEGSRRQAARRGPEEASRPGRRPPEARSRRPPREERPREAPARCPGGRKATSDPRVRPIRRVMTRGRRRPKTISPIEDSDERRTQAAIRRGEW